MYKKIISKALLCAMALSGISTILEMNINANDGSQEGDVAIAFDANEAPYTKDTGVYIDKGSIGSNNETGTIVDEKTPSIAENTARDPERPFDKRIEEAPIEMPDYGHWNNDNRETEVAISSRDESTSEWGTPDQTSSNENVDHIEMPEPPKTGSFEILENSTPSSPSSAPRESTRTTVQSVRQPSTPSGQWQLSEPEAGPYQENRKNNRPKAVPGSMLDYRVVKTAEYNPMDPTTWKQSHAPYSNEFFAYSGTTFGDASCGIHSLASLFLKTGYAIEGFNAVDAYNWALANGFGVNNDGMPAYAWTSLERKTGGYLENAGSFDESSGEDGAEWVRNEYAKGNFVVIGTTLVEGPHAVVLDYVDEQGRIVTLDSGAGHKYLSQQAHNGHVRYAFSFKVAGIPSYNSPKLWAGESLRSFKPIRDAKYKHFAQHRNDR